MAVAEVRGDICYGTILAGLNLGEGEHHGAPRAAVHSLRGDQEPREVRAGHLDVVRVAGVENVCKV